MSELLAANTLATMISLIYNYWNSFIYLLLCNYSHLAQSACAADSDSWLGQVLLLLREAPPTVNGLQLTDALKLHQWNAVGDGQVEVAAAWWLKKSSFQTFSGRAEVVGSTNVRKCVSSFTFDSVQRFYHCIAELMFHQIIVHPTEKYFRIFMNIYYIYFILFY